MWHSVTLVLINVQLLFKKMQSTFENFNIWQKSNLVLTKIATYNQIWLSYSFVNFKHNKYFGVKVYLKRKINASWNGSILMQSSFNGIARREAMLVYL